MAMEYNRTDKTQNFDYARWFALLALFFVFCDFDCRLWCPLLVAGKSCCLKCVAGWTSDRFVETVAV